MEGSKQSRFISTEELDEMREYMVRAVKAQQVFQAQKKGWKRLELLVSDGLKSTDNANDMSGLIDTIHAVQKIYGFENEYQLLLDKVYGQMYLIAHRTRNFPRLSYNKPRILRFLTFIPSVEEKTFFLHTILTGLSSSEAFGSPNPMKSWTQSKIEETKAAQALEMKDNRSDAPSEPAKRGDLQAPFRLRVKQTLFVYHIGKLIAAGIIEIDKSARGVPWALLAPAFVQENGAKLNPKSMAQTYQNINNHLKNTSPPNSEYLDNLVEELRQIKERMDCDT